MFKVKVNFILDKVSPWNNNNNNHLTQVDREEGFSPVAELKKCFASITVTFTFSWLIALKTLCVVRCMTSNYLSCWLIDHLLSALYRGRF